MGLPFQMTPCSDPSIYVPVFCQFRRKGATVLILIYFESFINFGAFAKVEFCVNFSFISTEKQDLFFNLLCCQECQKPDAIHIFFISIPCSD